jgi:hypothetical protein
MYEKFREVDIAELRRVLSYNPDTGVFTWKVNRNGYVKKGARAGNLEPNGHRRIGIFGTKILEHRLAWALVKGSWPSTLVDHRDGRRDNNRFSNLRIATLSQNRANSKKTKSRSGFRGVYWNNKCKKWQAAIRIDRKLNHLGMFADPKDAHAAYLQAAKTQYGGFGMDHEKWGAS